jgi:hypothetical protein
MDLGHTQDEIFERTALKMNSNSNSFDILDRTGKVIARINLLETDEYYDIDIIRNEYTSKNSKILAWETGKQIVNQNLPETNKVIACILMKHSI